NALVPPRLFLLTPPPRPLWCNFWIPDWEAKGHATIRERAAAAGDLPMLLAAYLSHPAYVAMNEGARGEQGCYDLEMLRRDGWSAGRMPGRHRLAILSRESGEPVGIAERAQVGPAAGAPWLGALVIAAGHARRGLGSEAFARLAEHVRAARGATALRLG